MSDQDDHFDGSPEGNHISALKAELAEAEQQIEKLNARVVELMTERDQAREQLVKQQTPVAWRWMNMYHPEQGWTYTEQEVKEHPNLLLKVQPLFAHTDEHGEGK